MISVLPRNFKIGEFTGPRSAVGNVSGYRCEADCRSILSWRLIISTVILLPSAESFKKGCCQLQAKVCARLLVNGFVQACPGKKCG